MNSNVLIIGCGSEWVSDDAIGLHVVRELQKTNCSELAEMVEAGTPGLNLINIWEGRERVILVDAVKSGHKGGTVHRFEPSCLPPKKYLPVSLHGFNAVDAIELSAVLDRLPSDFVVIGIEVENETPFHQGISERVSAALPEAVEKIRQELQRMNGT